MEYIINIIRDISVLLGIWVAIYGIDSWRREHSGKRQIELAEETLALFYELRDVIADIRNPLSWKHETSEVERAKFESDMEYEARKRASVVFYRFKKNSEVINELHSLRYRFMAQIGCKEAKPFDDIRSVINEITAAARRLSYLWARTEYRSDKEAEKSMKQIQQYEAIFWDGLEDEDPINDKVLKIIDEIEATCKKVIEGAGSLHGFLNMNIWPKRLTKGSN
ncbi:MAG: hypothetical protein MI976_18800 [Pseudomonadales bacterium]|nr:hypothetical protein [Pseudomonadales bacterium]